MRRLELARFATRVATITDRIERLKWEVRPACVQLLNLPRWRGAGGTASEHSAGPRRQQMRGSTPRRGGVGKRWTCGGVIGRTKPRGQPGPRRSTAPPLAQIALEHWREFEASLLGAELTCEPRDRGSFCGRKLGRIVPFIRRTRQRQLSLAQRRCAAPAFVAHTSNREQMR
jgi:hypothetical protein